MASLTDTFNIFFWGTFGFFILKYMTGRSIGNPWIWSMVYIAVTILIMYFVNVGIFKDKCGASDAWVVFKATFFPWVLMFGLMVVIINVFPGWKAPFSNTFGYMFALLSPSVTKLKTFVKPEYKVIQTNPLLLINQLNMSNIGETETHIQGLFVEENTADVVALIQQLVFTKDLISEWVWFNLAGFVTISTSYSMLANEVCKSSVEQQSETYNKNLLGDDTPKTPTSNVTYHMTE